MKKLTIAVLIICAISPWTWTILHDHLYLGILAILTAVLFSLEIISKKRNLKISYLKYLLLLVLLIVSFTLYLDRTRYAKSDNEVINTLYRHEYYAKELGKIYKNRFGILYFNNVKLLFREYSDNMFSILHINNYFNTGFSKTRFLFIFLPFMILGLYLSLREINDKKLILFIFLFGIMGLLDTSGGTGPFILYPFFIYFIVKGLVYAPSILGLGKHEKN